MKGYEHQSYFAKMYGARRGARKASGSCCCACCASVSVSFRRSPLPASRAPRSHCWSSGGSGAERHDSRQGARRVELRIVGATQAQKTSMARLILNDLDVETAEKLERRAKWLGTTPEEEASRLIGDRLRNEPPGEPAARGADAGASDPRFVRQDGFLVFTGVVAPDEIPDHRALREERVESLLKGAPGRHCVEETSTCVECGKDMETRYEDRALDDLPEVMIADLAVEHCPACSATEEVWPAMEPMYRALAAAIIAKPYRLMGAEIRVLRNVLGWTAVQLAAQLGVSSSQVSRWENDREPVGPVADRMVRAILALREGMSLSTDRLAAIGKERRPLRATLRHTPGGWNVETEDLRPARAVGAE